METANSKFRIQNSKLLLPFCFFCLFLVSCSVGEWHVYETSEFSIEFPGVAKDTATMEGGFAGGRTYFEPVQGSLDSNMYYSVSLYTLPDSLSVMGNEVDDLLKNDVRIYAFGIGGVLADSGHVVKNGDAQGLEFKVFLEGNKGVATIRKFAVGKHLYTLLVVTENMKLNNAAIRRFMESFKLKKPAAKK